MGPCTANVSKCFLWRRISEVTERRVHASRKRCLFSCRRNSPWMTSGLRSWTGREFHRRGPAAAEVLSPQLLSVGGSTQVETSAERRERRVLSDTRRQSSASRRPMWHVISRGAVAILHCELLYPYILYFTLLLFLLVTVYQKKFSLGIGSKFATNACLHIPPRLKHVATLTTL